MQAFRLASILSFCLWA